MQRTTQLIVALLSILKAGVVYVILDPDVPPERSLYIIRDVAAALVVLDQAAGFAQLGVTQTFGAVVPSTVLIITSRLISCNYPPNNTCLIMSGAPGSGKSTVANLLAQSINGVVIDHDLIRSFFLENDIFFEQSARLSYRFQWILAEDMIKQERNVIIDSTCNYNETLDQGTALAREYGFNYRYVECRVNDVELLDRRLRNRIPLRSQRTGVSLPPPDANGACHNEDYHTLFKRWIERPCRPDGDAIVVDSTSSPEECRDYILKQIVICVTSSANAVRAALKAVIADNRSKARNEIIVPAITAVSTAEAVMMEGLQPSSLCDLCPLRILADEHGIKLISDSAQSFGAICGKSPAIDLADATIYSTGFPKVFHTGGAGGIMVCSKSQADWLEQETSNILRHEALPETNAYMSLRALDRLLRDLEARSDLAEMYRSLLRGTSGISFQHVAPSLGTTNYQLSVTIDATKFGLDSKGLYQTLQAENILCSAERMRFLGAIRERSDGVALIKSPVAALPPPKEPAKVSDITDKLRDYWIVPIIDEGGFASAIDGSVPCTILVQRRHLTERNVLIDEVCSCISSRREWSQGDMVIDELVVHAKIGTDSDGTENETPLAKAKGFPETLINNTRIASYRGERAIARSFTLFPQLPPEIRIRIWQHAISVPRIVEIEFNTNWRYRSKTPPTLLSCNRESRKEFLKAATVAQNGFDWIGIFCISNT
ncbi:hypothetical protein G7Y89_g10008 [Cudoniella acicularis]|uniref:Zeta toxin domain-containing protein n=1 Tax=Cudoniella acicularis TaxID=354080 RepID=A0A8H4RDK6_9HELO|nr:hypothetical protein G7Y89_g10008 [Cudoniella acicularis]